LRGGHAVDERGWMGFGRELVPVTYRIQGDQGRGRVRRQIHSLYKRNSAARPQCRAWFGCNFNSKRWLNFTAKAADSFHPKPSCFWNQERGGETGKQQRISHAVGAGHFVGAPRERPAAPPRGPPQQSPPAECTQQSPPAECTSASAPASVSLGRGDYRCATQPKPHRNSLAQAAAGHRGGRRE
jgi:hypothetical protein